MKLYYHDDFGGIHNFGDYLNAWLWPKLLHGILDEEKETAFIGIGTLLNDRLKGDTPHARTRIVFSTGAGYSDIPFSLDNSFRVYCVRGPLSAQQLGLPVETAITDGALLLRRVYQSRPAKKFRFAYMPHIGGATQTAWQSVCGDLGIDYIDPCGSTEEVLESIGSTEVLFAEAMHGAIAADALRVPWVPIVTSPHILPFKWEDWCRSVGVAYRPEPLSALYDLSPIRDLLLPARKIKYQLNRTRTLSQINRLMRTARPMLSSEETMERLTVRLEESLDRFKTDVHAGRLREPRGKEAA